MLKVSWFPELTPQEKIIEEKILDIIKKNYQQVGYTPIETPAVERNQVLTAKGWNEVSKQIFWLYGLAQGCEKDTKDYSLHFDLTVPFARYVVDHKGELNFPFKRSQIQKVWRGERAQKWRFREFYQADIDVIWNETRWENQMNSDENNLQNLFQSPNLFYDAEIIFTLVKTLKDIFQNLSLDYSFKVRLNNKKIISWFIKDLNLEDKIIEITTIIDKKDKVSPEEFVKLLEKEALSQDQINKIQQFINQDLQTAEKLSTNEEYLTGLEELKQVIKFLEQLGISEYEVDFGIVRGLDYYTWTVFETFIDEERQLGSIASGGRYENFTKFIDPKTNFSGVWGSIGVSRLESFIFDKIQLNQKTTSEYLILNFPETTTQCLSLFTKFLKEWKKVEFYPTTDKFKKQLKYADKKWIKYCVILGENELNENCYILKNMETWEQEKIPLK